MENDRQIFVACKGTCVAFKLVPHNTDPESLVIKAKHPELGSMLAMAAGLPISGIKVEQGAAYFLTFVPRASFELGMGKALTDILTGKMTVSYPQHAPTYGSLTEAVTGAADEDEEEDEDTDEDDEG